jgi:hypothetical protein
MGALVAVPVGNGVESASRVFDRTVVCRVVATGYPDAVRSLQVSASPFHPSVGGFPSFPRASVTDLSGPETRVSAGIWTWHYNMPGSVWLTDTACQPTKVRIPLSRSGLRGGVIQATEASAGRTCDLPPRVLIRVRAVFSRGPVFTRDPQAPHLTVAKGRVATGVLVVTTVQGRKPIVFASVSNARRNAGLFVEPSRCSRRG